MTRQPLKSKEDKRYTVLLQICITLPDHQMPFLSKAIDMLLGIEQGKDQLSKSDQSIIPG